MVEKTIAFLSLGSNQGDRRLLLQQATDRIRASIGSVVCSSRWYETEPWGSFDTGEVNPFLNIAVGVSTGLTPRALLAAVNAIEHDLGRRRNPAVQSDNNRVYSSRPIDIDIILYGSAVVDTPELTIPHPRMHLRRFVLQPLCDIAPETVHPLLKQTIQQLLLQCPDSSSLSCCC